MFNLVRGVGLVIGILFWGVILVILVMVAVALGKTVL